MDEGDSSKDVTLKINSRLFTRCRVYSSSLKMSNAGEFAWSLFLGDRLKMLKMSNAGEFAWSLFLGDRLN